jgi:hypothetical protein
MYASVYSEEVGDGEDTRTITREKEIYRQKRERKK